MPGDMKDVAGFPLVVAALAARGYSPALLEKICYGNWLRVLEATWGAIAAVGLVMAIRAKMRKPQP